MQNEWNGNVGNWQGEIWLYRSVVLVEQKKNTTHARYEKTTHRYVRGGAIRLSRFRNVQCVRGVLEIQLG